MLAFNDFKCKNCGRVTTTALPVRAVFPTSSCPFKVCSLSCGLLFHGSWKMAEAEAMEEPGFGGPTGLADTQALPGIRRGKVPRR